MKKRVLIPLLLACLLAALLPAAALAATANNIAYYDWSDSEKKLVPKTCSAATVVSSDDTTWGDDGNGGWYVVNSNVTITSRITVTGEVHLILADGKTLTAEVGIRVADDDDDYTNGSPNALTIYGQTAGSGGLTVPDPVLDLKERMRYHAAIGGNGGSDVERGGTVTINGGNINVRGWFGAGIGGGGGGNPSIGNSAYGKGGGIVTINDGTVSAWTWYGAGIGGGSSEKTNSNSGDGGSVTIRGGTVTVSSVSGSGIGKGNIGLASGTFQTTSDGNAVIFATSILDQSDKANWRGVIFESDTGKVYGKVTPIESFTIPSGKTLLIESGNNLTISNGVTATNYGKIYMVGGSFTGDADNLYYSITTHKSTADNLDSYNGRNFGKAGSEITLTPDAPTKLGIEHSGWSVDPQKLNLQIVDNKFVMPKSALNIIALYDYIDYTVIFDSNGGSAVANKTVHWDDAVLGGVDHPTRSGWTFAGWMCGNKPVSAQTRYKELVASDSVKSITLTAQWTINDYTVTFDTAGGSAVADKAVYWDDAVLGGVDHPTRSGWTFAGWKYGDTVVTEQTKYSELAADDAQTSIALTAQWTNNDYTVTFDTAGGSAIADKAVYWDDAVLGGVDHPTRSGFAFAGWMCGNKPVSAQTRYKELVASDSVKSITLTAQWTNNDYTVTFDTAGGSAIADKAVYWDDAVLGGVAHPTRSGFAFAGWMCGDQPVTEQTRYSELAADDAQTSIALTAQWTDTTFPVISGIENGKVYCAAPTVTVTDNKGIASVTVNGAPVLPDSNGKFTLSATDGEQTIVVTDAEGNRVEMTVTVNDGHRGGTATCVERAVCVYCGEEYGEVDGTNHHLGHQPAGDATVTRPGNIEYWYCTDCHNYFSDADGKNAIAQEDTVTPKLPPEIIEGMGQSILAGEKKALSFTSNAAFGDFIRVELDGETLSADSYTAKEGSTIVTLKAAYVATLPAGEHTIGIVSDGGTAETTFSVHPQLPQTGDGSSMALWMTLLLACGGLLIAVCIRKRSAE